MSEARSNVVQMPHGRIPPHNLDAEQSLLGGILLDGKAADFDELQVSVQPVDFYRDAHRKTYEAMCALASAHEPVDRVSVKNKMLELGTLEGVGGEEFLDRLDENVPILANLGHYAKIIRERAIARRMIEAASSIAQLGYEQHGDVNEYADESERRILAVRASMPALIEAMPMRQIIAEVFKDIEARFQHDTTLTGVPSGLDALDAITNGFQPGDLVVIAARPSHGKTSLVLDTLRAVGRTGTGSSAIFEMEMPRKQLVERLLAGEGRVDSQAIRTGKIVAPGWENLAAAAGHLADMEIEIHDQPRTVLEIRALARRRAAKMAGTGKPLRVVAVDYLQRMSGTGNESTRDEQLSRISRELKSLAIELNVPVLAVSSMNRDIEKRSGARKPQMSDLRECGALEFDADLILFVHREEVYDKNNEAVRGTAEIIVGKNRNGPPGEAKVAFRKEFISFANIDERVVQRSLPLRDDPQEREEPPPPTERYP